MSAYIPDFAILVQFAIASFVLAITPGPDMALYVGRAITHGKDAGLACFSGCVTGVLVHTLLVALGLSALLKTAPTAFFALKILGAGYLIWLAVQAILHGSSLTLKKETISKKSSLLSHYLTGIGINILNPKVVLFFLTFLPQFVSVADPHATGKLIFLGIFFLIVSIPTIIPTILVANRFAHFLTARPRVARGLDYLFAGVFSAFAIKLILAQNK